MPEMANDRNEKVTLEVCEFWLTLAEDADLAMHLHPLLSKVAPVLLDCMVYGEDGLLWLEGDAEDAAVLDKDMDIKLRHYGGGKMHGLEHDNANGEVPKSRIGAYGEETIDLDEEDEYDLDDEDFVEEMSTEWNLRKCTAAGLDIFVLRPLPRALLRFSLSLRSAAGMRTCSSSSLRSSSLNNGRKFTGRGVR
jgi:transportin-1